MDMVGHNNEGNDIVINAILIKYRIFYNIPNLFDF